nr:DNA methyltransferase [Corynebacterium uropygiale]
MLSVKTIEQRVKNIAGQPEYSDDFLFDLLLAYGRSKGNITRLRKGSINVAEDPSREYAQKDLVYYRRLDATPAASPAERESRFLHALEQLRTHERVVRFKTRFVIVTDHEWLAALDTKTNENRVFPLREVDKHYAFFLPWAGMEKAQFIAERPADTKAAERMGELFDALVSTNAVSLATDADRHGLNIFFTRLLFCYFAEDTDLFPAGSFTHAIASRSREDGSDTAEVITEIFEALDIPDKSDLPEHLQLFPYVNGRLFSADAAYQVPQFDRKSRDLLILMGRLIWQDINPDIFGSMFQAVVQTGSRSELGQHYTSVPNILKTIEPLFLDELREAFDDAYSSVPRLEKLLDRIGKIKVFDPACGSGNFLVIAYKELRRLEHAILDRLAHLSPKHQTLFSDSMVKIDHFYGIEIDDFAAEVAVLSLWIAKHQMNREYKEKFGVDLPMIPLRSMGQIRCANACRIDWNDVCPHTPEEEVYLIGNPPYVGAKKRSPEQTEDLQFAYGEKDFSKNIDYISAWFFKGGQYIAGSSAQLAFVTTNSITQGEHVGLLFPDLFALGLEIGYAYTSFKWSNSAKHNAGVTVSVINLRESSNKKKLLYTGGISKKVSAINGYLSEAPSITISRRTAPLTTFLPLMKFGMMAYDGGNLLLNSQERSDLLEIYPEASQFLKKHVGSREFINGIDRYCLWIEEQDLSEAETIPPIEKRINTTREYRESRDTRDALKLAQTPYRFREQHKPTNSIIVPKVSSERRTYVPIGFIGPDTVISDLAFAVYDAEPWLFALLTSKMHMAWLRAVGGKMKTDFRYSNTIVYNNFPVPHLTGPMKEKLTQAALRILDVREYFCEKTLAELYDPEEMPELLCEAHAENDALVDSIYRRSGFESDEDRLAALFTLYQKMSDEQDSTPARSRKKKAK